MRILMWFTIGFAAACGLCGYGLPDAWVLPLLISMAVAAIAAGLVGRNGKVLPRAAVVLLGCAAGLCWFLGFQKYYLSPTAVLDGVESTAVLTASDYGYATDYGTGFDAAMTIEGRSYQVRAYLDEEKDICPGDTVTGTFRFRLTTSEGQEGATYHPGKGIFLLAYQENAAEIVSAAERSPQYYPAILADRITAILDSLFPEDTGAFAKALLLGDSSGLDYETDTALKLSGIRHVVAVSGLHVSILFALLGTVTFRRRYLMALTGFPVLFLFAAVAGFTPSVTRACIMSGLMLLAQLLNKEYDGASALSFACLVMLAVNPLVITSVSFQLSAASVAGILLFQPGIHSWMQGQFRDHKVWYARWISGSVSVTISAMITTTPLCAWHFGTVSLIGVVTNLLTLWVISFIFYGIMAVCCISLVWNAGAAMLAQVISWPIRYVLRMAGFLGGLPLAAVYTRSVYITLWLVLCYVLAAVFLLSRKRRPGVLGCCICLGLCIALLASWAEPLTDSCRMTVLDVGQGQSILLQSEGRTYLIDCGGDSDTETADIVAETLLSQGIDRLDGIILTHFDRDHAGAVENLLTRVPADLLLMPDIEGAKVIEGQTNAVYLDRDLELSFGASKLTVFGPIFSGSSNENSLCVLFEGENCVILVTGDRSAFGERMLMRKTALPQVDVLVAGHHGSADSTSAELLAQVRPETVVISVGENIYGHPAQSLLDRLAEFGCQVYRTDQNGTILFRR